MDKKTDILNSNGNNGAPMIGVEGNASAPESEWTCNTTESMKLSIVYPSGNLTERSPPFSPEFTYPIFGQEETVFGYKGLEIEIQYASGSLHCYYNVKHSAKYQPSSSSTKTVSFEPEDVESKLREYLGEDCTTNYDNFIRIAGQEEKKFRPIGDKVDEYSVEIEDETGEVEEHCFEIYKASLSCEKFKKFHQRMQFFVLLFIEGSSYIEDDDEKWEIYTVFRRKGLNDAALYDFVGYCTTYPFCYWPDNKRLRISQFLILPPYQGQGHGNQLYSTIYQHCLRQDDIHELTVEDPNAPFSDLREKSDMRYLLEHKALDGIHMPVAPEMVQKLQESFKLTKRQVQTYIELHLLSKLDRRNVQQYNQFRLLVKERLLLRNYEILKEVSVEEKKEKLEAAFQNVMEDYGRLCESI